MSEPTPRSTDTRWRTIEAVGLKVVAIGVVLYGAWYLYIALGFGAETAGDLELRLLAGGVGVVTVLAGVLMLVRRREDLVAAILGAFTATAFTLGAASLTRADATWRVLFPAAIFGGLLFGFVAFRGAFRRRAETGTPGA